FVVPKATFPPVGARIMDLQSPAKKMSKSDDSPMGCVMMLDPPKTIEKKIKSAVTDSGTEVRFDREEEPGISDLIESYAAVTGKPAARVREGVAVKPVGGVKDRGWGRGRRFRPAGESALRGTPRHPRRGRRPPGPRRRHGRGHGRRGAGPRGEGNGPSPPP